MAFIIVSSKGTEVSRHELVGGLTLGRAPDCGLSVHDILLSRHHCRIEPSGRDWVVLDMRSKNGTWLDGERIGRRSLRHEDVVRAGNTSVRFMMGELAAAADVPAAPRKRRPADPFEALEGTVFDFDSRKLDDAPELQRSPSTNGTPYPRPIPRDPASYARDGVYSLLEEIASSSWDSIYANASRPLRPAPEFDGRSSTRSGQVPQASEIVEIVPKARTVKRPQAPMRRRPVNTTSPAPDTVPARSRSRLQVDLSLQAHVVSTPRPFRGPLPRAPAATALSTRPARGMTRRAWRAIARTLTTIHRRIAPRGVVVLV